MSPAASLPVDEQGSSEEGSVGQPSASESSVKEVKREPASQTKKWFFHFEIGFKKTVRVTPERAHEPWVAPAEKAAGGPPQVRMLTAVAPAAPAVPPAAVAPLAAMATLLPTGAPNPGAAGGGSGSTTTSYSLYTQTDTGYSVSPPNTGLPPLDN